MSIPPISRGLGRLTPQVWDRIAATVQRSEAMQRPRARAPQMGRTRWGIIASAAVLSANRWTYTLRTAKLDRTTKAFAVGDTDEPTWEALNALEAPNTASASGINVDLSALPGTYALMPIAAGAVVLCTLLGEDWIFVASNGIDGAC